MPTAPTTLGQLARLVGGRLEGDESVPIYGAASLDRVERGEITLLDQPGRLARLATRPAAAAVVPSGVHPAGIPFIEVEDVHAAFTAIVVYFRPQPVHSRLGISPQAIVHPTATLGSDVDIHPGATIGAGVRIGRGATIHSGVHVMAGCSLGDEVTIMPGAVLYEQTQVGPRTVIHANAVIGAHGFGYRTVDGRHRPAPQLGRVEIGADVEIGASTTIDRGTYDATVVDEGTKIDNLVMVAHNCRLGKHNLICSQVGIAGSTSTGDHVVMAGQVGVRDHVRIGDRAVLGAKAGVSNDVPDGATMIGIPATPERDQKIKQAALAKLPEMRQELKQLRKLVMQLAEVSQKSRFP